MNIDLLNHFIWKTAHDLVTEHGYFLVNNDEGILTLRKSEGFITTFLWLIPADALTKKKIKRELEDTLTWMAAYRRKTPSLLFRSIHLYLYSTPQEESDLKAITNLGSLGITGRYQTSAWAVDLTASKFNTPKLFSQKNRQIKTEIQEILHYLSHSPRMEGETLYSQIFQWQQEMNQSQFSTQQQYQKKTEYRIGAPVTFILAGINLIIWMLMTIYGGSKNPETLIRFGAKYNPAIINGEYWRLITPMFLHIGGMHLWFNSTALLSLGGPVERIYGSIRFLMIYIIAGIFGSVASFLFSNAISAGASGAIFGLFGALLFFATKNSSAYGHTMRPGIIGGLSINILLGFLIPGIDNYAHIGGLLSGYIAAFIIGLPKLKVKQTV